MIKKDDPISKSNDVVDALAKVAFGINRHWQTLASKLGVPADELFGLRQESLLHGTTAALMDGVDYVLKHEILTWQELINVVREIEPVTGDRLTSYIGI